MKKLIKPTPYSLTLERAQLDKLRALSNDSGVPIAEMLRRGVDLYLAQAQLVDAHVVWKAKDAE